MSKTTAIQTKDADNIQGLIDAFRLRNVGEEIYDPSTHERIVVTEARIMLAAMALAGYAQAEQMRWIIANQVRTQKLWVEAGCNSYEEFAEKRWHLGNRQARLLAQRGERRMLLINAAGANADAAQSALDGLNKSDQLTIYDLPQPIYEDITETLWQSPDGREMDVEEAAKHFSGDLLSKIKTLKKDFDLAKEEKRTAESERDHYKKLAGKDIGAIGELTLKIDKMAKQLDEAKRRGSLESASHEKMTTMMADIRSKLPIFRAYVGRDGELADDTARALAMEAAGLMAQLGGEAWDISKAIMEQFEDEVGPAKPRGKK